MNKLVPLSLLALLFAALPALPQDGAAVEDEVVSKERRVVISVSHDGDGDGQQYIWVQRDGEEPVLRTIPMGKPRGYLGVNLTEMTPELRQVFGAPRELGVLINRVIDDTPAARAGLQAGDVLTRIEGRDIKSSAGVQAEIFAREQGDVVTLEIYRERKLQQISATLDQVERPRLNLAEFGPEAFGEGGPRTGFRFVGPNVEVLPLDKLKNLERLELKTIPFDQDRLERILEGLGNESAFPDVLSTDELEERLRELEKKIQELEQRLKKRSANKPDESGS